MFRHSKSLPLVFACCTLPVPGSSTALPQNEPPRNCAISAGPFSTQVSGITGEYGGYVGYPVDRSAEVSLQTEFLVVWAAWFEVVYFDAFGGGDFIFHLNGQPLWGGSPCGAEARCFDLSPATLRSGTAIVRAQYYQGEHCLDCLGFISDAEISIEGISIDSPQSLFGFAEFQACFGLTDLLPEDCCSIFDADGDGEVTLLDLALIYQR